MKRNQAEVRAKCGVAKAMRERKAYARPSLRRLGVLQSVAASDLKWVPRRY